MEFRAPDGALKMVSIVDALSDGLSWVYTFYDPHDVHRSLGAYGILWQIDACQRRGLAHLYLGYWIEQSPKMAYKSLFHPYEILSNGMWIRPSRSLR